MNIAMLNKKIIFEKNDVFVDDIGNHTNTWTTYYVCMGTISGEGGDEELIAGQTVDKADLSVTVRYCSKAAAITTTGYRVSMDGDYYDIDSIDHFSYKHQALKFRLKKVKR